MVFISFIKSVISFLSIACFHQNVKNLLIKHSHKPVFHRNCRPSALVSRRTDGATLYSRNARKFACLPLVSKLPDGFAAKPNRFPCAWRKKTRFGVRVAPPENVLTEKMSFCKCIYEKNEIINMLFDHIIVIVRRYSLGVCSAIFLKTRLKFRRESKPHSSATLKIVLLEYRKRKRASLTR